LPPRDILLRCELIVRKSCGMISKKERHETGLHLGGLFPSTS